jgi:hypothetical protein
VGKSILHRSNVRKVNWIRHVLCRNCLLKHVIEGIGERKIEVTGRGRRRYRQLLDDLKKTRRYWKLKEEALGRSLWRTGFGRGYRPVATQATYWWTFSEMSVRIYQRKWRNTQEDLNLHQHRCDNFTFCHNFIPCLINTLNLCMQARR